MKEECSCPVTSACGVAPEKLVPLQDFLKVMADANRLRIVCLLRGGERCSCGIAEDIALPQNLVSHHLKILRDAEIVETRKEGTWVYYSLNKKVVQDHLNFFDAVIS